MSLTAQEIALVRIPCVAVTSRVAVLGHTSKALLWQLWALDGRPTDCIQLSDLIGCSQATISQALRALRKLGLIWSLREGRSGGYRPNRHTLREAEIRKLIEPVPDLFIQRQRKERDAAVAAFAVVARELAEKLEWDRSLASGVLLGRSKGKKGVSTTAPVTRARHELVQLLLSRPGATTGLVAAATGLSQDHVRDLARGMRSREVAKV